MDLTDVQVELNILYHRFRISLKTGGVFLGVRVKIPRDRLTKFCWIGSHFHDCIDFYGVAFLAVFNRVTRMGLHIFEILILRKLWQVRIHKQEDSW